MGMGIRATRLLLGRSAARFRMKGTDTFVDYTFSPPVDVSAFTSFFVGDMTPMNNGPEHFYQGIDQNSPLHRQSWIAANERRQCSGYQQSRQQRLHRPHR